jgi:hypothetical protein
MAKLELRAWERGYFNRGWNLPFWRKSSKDVDLLQRGWGGTWAGIHLGCWMERRAVCVSVPVTGIRRGGLRRIFFSLFLLFFFFFW